LKRINPVLAAVLFMSAAVLPVQAQRSALRVAGSSTIQPLATEIAKLSDAGPILVEGGGSGAGISGVLAGTADIGMVSRALSQAEKQQLKFATIGYDALVFIVNDKNPLDAIDKELVRRIFDGSLGNWPDSKLGPVVPINKEIGRSTLELFEGYSGLFHPGRGRAGPAGTIALGHQIGSNLEMATIVGGLPGAVGYLSLGTAELLQRRGMPIRILALDGVPATRSSILNGTYGIARELNLVYRVETQAIQEFIGLFSTPAGVREVEADGFISVTSSR
jgi:phosphate transport system substrate-binding protein